jgi:hypothetical protein
LRLILAAFVAYALIIGSIGIITRLPEGWSKAAAIAVPLVAIPLVLVLFNKGMLRRLIVGHEKYVQYELQKGRAERRTFRVSRALSFDDLRTSCMAHFLELNDGSVMCLYGQYLYDYEPIDDDPELNQPRLFPTSEFSAIRLLHDGALLDFEIGGDVVATKVIEEPEDYDVIANLGFNFEDGEVAEGVSFGQVEAALAAKTT